MAARSMSRLGVDTVGGCRVTRAGVFGGPAVLGLAAATLMLACSKGPEAGRVPLRAGDAREAARVVPVTAAQVREVVAAARGKVVLVNVWATWCNPCREEFPHLLRLQSPPDA